MLFFLNSDAIDGSKNDAMRNVADDNPFIGWRIPMPPVIPCFERKIHHG
jgi:hypothetical protein